VRCLGTGSPQLRRDFRPEGNAQGGGEKGKSEHGTVPVRGEGGKKPPKEGMAGKKKIEERFRLNTGRSRECPTGRKNRGRAAFFTGPRREGEPRAGTGGSKTGGMTTSGPWIGDVIPETAKGKKAAGPKKIAGHQFVQKTALEVLKSKSPTRG